MKFSLIWVALVLFLGSCSKGSTIADDEMIEYKLQPGQYAVVIIVDDQTTLAMAKKAARFRAAELTVMGGYRYFLIQSEMQTQVIRSKNLEATNHEIIVEGNFATTQLQPSSPHETVHTALRVVFQCFKEKPKGRSFKACHLTDCSAQNSGE